MSMQFIDVTGVTDAEAIEKALSQLGLERDDVSVEILERAKKGIFGIGASPAKVRVTYEVPDKPAEPAVVADPKKPAPASVSAPAPERPRREKRERTEKPPAPVEKIPPAG